MRALVRIEIVRYNDDHQPGFVECRLTDFDGRVWSFEEKVPLVSYEYLDASSGYPRAGSVVCNVLSRDGDVVRVSVEPLSGYFECRVPAAVVVNETAEGERMRWATVPVVITEFVDDHQPGWVSGYIADADGHQWAFDPIKQVYVSRQYLDADTTYPVAGETDCRVVEERDGVTTVELLYMTLVDSADDVDHPLLRVPSAVLDYDTPDAEPGTAADGRAQ